MKAFGTLVEIGLVDALGKPILLGLGGSLTESEMADLWFAQMAAARVYFGTPVQFWQQVEADWIAGGRR